MDTDGLGCVLAQEPPELQATPAVEQDAWPQVALDDRLDAAVDGAFAEPLGTRAVVVRAGGRLVAELDGEDDGHAAHWWVNRRPDGSVRDARLPADASWAAGHDGQRVVVLPSAGVVVVRLGFDPGREGDELGVEELVADVVAAVQP